MLAAQYLREVLKEYSFTEDQRSKIRSAIIPLVKEVKAWAGPNLIRVIPTGSFAKGTAVRGNVDMDLFISLKHDTSHQLSDIYNSLSDYFEESYSIRRQNVSVRVNYAGLNVDLVPGKRQSQSGTAHSIYSSKAEAWTKTDIIKHIAMIKEGPHREIMRLIKVWRELNQLEFPSFLIELMVLESFKSQKALGLSQKLLQTLRFISRNIESIKIVDPANGNNIITDTISQADKQEISSAAKASVLEPYWERVVWGVFPKDTKMPL